MIVLADMVYLWKSRDGGNVDGFLHRSGDMKFENRAEETDEKRLKSRINRTILARRIEIKRCIAQFSRIHCNSCIFPFTLFTYFMFNIWSCSLAKIRFKIYTQMMFAIWPWFFIFIQSSSKYRLRLELITSNRFSIPK